MSGTTTENGSSGFSEAERSAMKARAAELRADGKAGAKRADGLQALLDSIEKMDPDDRVIAERFHVTVTTCAPHLLPKTWYGMPAYTNEQGKVLVAFKNAGKFGQRYSTLEFQDPAQLDDGDFWPVGFAIRAWSPTIGKRVEELVTAAAG